MLLDACLQTHSGFGGNLRAKAWACYENYVLDTYQESEGYSCWVCSRSEYILVHLCWAFPFKIHEWIIWNPRKLRRVYFHDPELRIPHQLPDGPLCRKASISQKSMRRCFSCKWGGNCVLRALLELAPTSLHAYYHSRLIHRRPLLRLHPSPANGGDDHGSWTLNLEQPPWERHN